MTMSFSLATALFKTKYGPISKNTYNSANVILGRVKKKYDFVGKKIEVAVPMGYSGGVGSGSTIPTANGAAYGTTDITSKKTYSTIQVEREAIKAASSDEGAFVRLTKEPVKKGVESFNRNMTRQLWNDGSGALGQFSGNQGGTAADPVVTILTTGSYKWKEANFEEKDYVNVNVDASVFEITLVDPDNKQITLHRISGAADLTAIGAGTHTIYMQNSKDADFTGLKKVLTATNGTLYGVTVGRRWKAFQKAAGGDGVTPDWLNEMMLGIHRQCGEYPNLISASYTQYKKIKNFMEDKKVFQIGPRDSKLKGKISFSGLEFDGPEGPVGIFMDRFVDEDAIAFLNDDYMTIHHRPDTPGWADDDGTVFLRVANKDEYEARYTAYGEFYAPPSFHGYLSGLAT
jgi:hypothetical protein